MAIPQPAHTFTGTEQSGESFVAWLNRVRLFHDIHKEPGAIDSIAALMSPLEFTTGTTLLKEGAEGSEAFFLMSGKVKVLKSIAGKEAFPVALLDAKDHPFFGEAALLQNDVRSATIRCESDGRCLVLQRRDFEIFCHDHPNWALPIIRKIGCVILERLHHANNDIGLLYNALVSEVKG
jgi:CRP-like cAMP-binding protein